MAHPTELDALYAFLLAAVVTALLTPFTMRFATAVGAIDEPRERGLSESATPLLGGLDYVSTPIVSVPELMRVSGREPICSRAPSRAAARCASAVRWLTSPPAAPRDRVKMFSRSKFA